MATPWCQTLLTDATGSFISHLWRRESVVRRIVKLMARIRAMLWVASSTSLLFLNVSNDFVDERGASMSALKAMLVQFSAAENCVMVLMPF